MIRGALYQFLQQDHTRLDELLHRADAGAAIDAEAFASFRAGLLRHIAMEEKVLLPEARRLRGGEPLTVARRLRADHAALAGLLVPTPTRDLIASVRKILSEHNPLEEGPGGVYETCEALAGAGVDALVARVKAIPEVRVARYFDGARAFAAIESLLRARTNREE